MKTYGTFSPTVLGPTELRIHTYLGDSIEQALADCLNIQLQDFAATKDICQFLFRYISKTVNNLSPVPLQNVRPPSQQSNNAYDVIPETQETTPSKLMMTFVHTSLTLLVGEMSHGHWHGKHRNYFRDYIGSN